MSTNIMRGGSEAVLEDGYTDEGSAREDKKDPSTDPANDEYWIRRARSSYISSQSWFDSSVRRRMEDNMRLFNSDHPRGSRYRDPAYDKRSKLFRPKTRSGMRKIEAATAAAFFATQDAVSFTAPNPTDRMQRLGADVQTELLNYRLQNDIPWFLTCIGGMQDAERQGVVISKQEWVYREIDKAFEENIIDEMTGETLDTRTTYERQTVQDHPDIRLRPVENVRFSPAADWRDPIQTSPYLIDMEPWYVGDIEERIAEGKQGKYSDQWRDLSRGDIRSALKQSYDPIRQAREGQREDRYEEASSDIQEHDIVWVHHNYIRINGEDWYYATVGTEIMLSEQPLPIDEVTPLGKRPYVMGICAIETHKPYPASLVELGRPVQEEINDITNLRIDNIRHIISPRYFIKRGTSVDVRSLMRNIAGGVTAMENPKEDVNIRQIADTTSSSFQEHDRLSVEFDELVGSFSQSSVAANHNISERVGNTQMLGESANQVTEMTIRTLAETWIEPVLQQIAELNRALESDEVVLSLVGQKMGIHPEVAFRMLELPTKVTVNVGFGATNPQKRLQKVSMAFSTIAGINPQWIEEADKGEVVTEIMGAVGFKSAERFFPDISTQDQEEDPRVTQLTQENEQLKAAIESGQAQIEARGKIEIQKTQMTNESRERIEMAKLQLMQRRDMSTTQLSQRVEQNKWKLAMLDFQIKQEQNAMRKQEMIQQRVALNHTITMDERQYALTKRQAEWEMSEERQQLVDAPSPKEQTEAIPDTTSKAAQDTKPKKIEQQKLDEPDKVGGKRIASQPKLKGDDKAGVLARDRYGKTPFEEG